MSAVITDPVRFIAEIQRSFNLDLTGYEDIITSFTSSSELTDWISLLIDESPESDLESMISQAIELQKPVTKRAAREAKSATPPPSPTRRPAFSCSCSGHEHGVYKNCTRCGKIVCRLEAERCGIEWCPYCLSWLLQKSDSSDAYLRALDHKNRLVAFDREGAKRTRVFDDHTDWFSEADNIWRTREDRDEAARRAMQHEEDLKAKKRQLKIRLNFDHQTHAVELVDSTPEVNAFLAQEAEDLDTHVFRDRPIPEGELPGNQLSSESLDILNFLRADISKLPLTSSAGSQSKAGKTDKAGKYEHTVTVEQAGDEEGRATTERLADFPVVTLRQPDASLVVHGFKRLLEFSGAKMLWIRAETETAKDEDISEAINLYNSLYASAGLPIPNFPVAFPTGCMLGLVEVEAAKGAVVEGVFEAREAALQGEFPALAGELAATEMKNVVRVKKARHLVFPHKFPGDVKKIVREADAQMLAESLVDSQWPLPDPWVPVMRRLAATLTPSSLVSLSGNFDVEVVDASGLVVIRRALGISDQRSLLGLFARLGMGEAPFFRPRIFPEDKRSAFDSSWLFRTEIAHADFFRTWLGKFWDAKNRKFTDRRVHVDDMTVAEVPSGLIDLYLASVISSSNKLRFSVSSEDPVCNFVAADFHEHDLVKFQEEFQGNSLTPVVRVFLGRVCSFSCRTASGDERSVRVESGDLLISGNAWNSSGSWRISPEAGDGLAEGTLVVALGKV